MMTTFFITLVFVFLLLLGLLIAVRRLNPANAAGANGRVVGMFGVELPKFKQFLFYACLITGIVVLVLGVAIQSLGQLTLADMISWGGEQWLFLLIGSILCLAGTYVSGEAEMWKAGRATFGGLIVLSFVLALSGGGDTHGIHECGIDQEHPFQFDIEKGSLSPGLKTKTGLSIETDPPVTAENGLEFCHITGRSSASDHCGISEAGHVIKDSAGVKIKNTGDPIHIGCWYRPISTNGFQAI